MKLYQGILARYLKANENLTKPPIKPKPEVESNKDISWVFKGIPKTYQRRTTQLLEVINRDNSTLKL